MLISEKFKKMQDALESFENKKPNLHALYDRLNYDLEIMKENLQFDIKNVEKNLDSRLTTQQREYQDYTTEWLQHEAKEFFEKVSIKSDGLTTETINKLSETITNNINKELENRLANLKSEIDLNELIESIRTDNTIIEKIKLDSINTITQDILVNKQSITNEIQSSTQKELLEYLKNKIDLDSIIKAALDTDIFTQEIKNKIDSKVIEIINTTLDSEALKAEINEQINLLKNYSESKKQEFNNDLNTFLESLKSGTNKDTQDSINALNAHIESLKTQSGEKLESFKQDLSTLLESLRENNNQALQNITQELYNAKDSIISDFNSKLLESAPYVITEAINNIVSFTMQNADYMLHIQNSVINKGYTYIKEFETQIKDSIIEKVTQYILDNVDSNEVKEILLQDSRITNIIKDAAYDSTKDILNHALLKEFVTNALKEKAKEILKSDELLRAEAEAQAHLVYMRLQSELVTITDVLDKLQNSYDIQNKLDILLEKEKHFQEALANAKQELQDELNTELPKFDTKIQDAINAYDKEQDKETDTKISTLQQELLALMQTLQDELDDLNAGQGNTNSNLKDLINELQEKIKDQEAINADQEARIKANTDLNAEQEAKIQANTQLNAEQEAKLQDSINKDKDLESKLEKLDKDLQDSIKNNQNNPNNPQNKPTTNNKYLQWS